jgi:hypothetical protein
MSWLPAALFLVLKVFMDGLNFTLALQFCNIFIRADVAVRCRQPFNRRDFQLKYARPVQDVRAARCPIQA